MAASKGRLAGLQLQVLAHEGTGVDRLAKLAAALYHTGFPQLYITIDNSHELMIILE